jgi:MiaB-like tRNA modifying enzyme
MSVNKKPNHNKKVYLETYGCTMNQADSDIIRGIISKRHEISDLDEADIVVINSCGVIEFTERKILKRIEELKRDKKVVVAGCLPRIAARKVREVADFVIGTNVYDIQRAVESALNNESFFLARKPEVDKSEFSPVKCRLRESVIAIVSISEGCLGKCTFCATKYARGRLRSFRLENVLREIENAVKEGFKEIQLTAQDTGVYGMDRFDYRLPELLDRISEVDGDFRVRVGMMNPGSAVKIIDALIKSFESEKIYKFLHVPVQSGDDRILSDMQRDHTVDDFIELVSEFRRNFRDAVISTDIIVGFPSEDEEAFWRSYELVEEIEPEIVNITKYSPRNCTPSSRLKDMPDWIKKERSRKLTALCRKIYLKRNRKFLRSVQKVLVTRNGKNGTLLSRTEAYRPVILDSGQMGEFYTVKIEEVTDTYLKGESI